MFRNHFNTEALGKYRSQSNVWRRNMFGQNESSNWSKHSAGLEDWSISDTFMLYKQSGDIDSSIFMVKVCWRSMCACEVHMTKVPALLQSCGQQQ